MSDGVDETVGGVHVRVEVDSDEVMVGGSTLTVEEASHLARLLAATAAIAHPKQEARRLRVKGEMPRAGDVLREEASVWWVMQEDLDRASALQDDELGSLDLTPGDLATLTADQLLLWSWSRQAQDVAAVARGHALEFGVRLGSLGLRPHEEE